MAGLHAGTQRFVIPWWFEVDEQGRPMVVAAALPPDRGSAAAQLLLGSLPVRRGSMMPIAHAPPGSYRIRLTLSLGRARVHRVGNVGRARETHP